jgi:hypothetical protein
MCLSSLVANVELGLIPEWTVIGGEDIPGGFVPRFKASKDFCYGCG